MPYSLYDPSIRDDEYESRMRFSFIQKAPMTIDWNARVAEVQQLKQALDDKRAELRTAQEMVGSLETDLARAERDYKQARKALRKDMGDGDGEAAQ